MKFIHKILTLILVCFSLAGCLKSNDEKVLGSAIDSANKNPTPLIAMPDCARRDKDMKYLNGVSCTPAERKAWNDSQHNL